MTNWIIIGVLYALVLVLFGLFGGIGAAGEALRMWGRASARIRSEQHSPSA